MQDAWSHHAASQDPVAARLLSDHGPLRLRTAARPSDRFAALARAVCFQQLAGAAASTIWGRVQTAVSGDVTPHAVLTIGPEALRGAGLSTAKTSTIIGLAGAVMAGEVELQRMGRLPDEVVIDQLVAVRGIGRWTAEMFLMFTLHRPDVWPTGDLGVRMGYGLAFGVQPAPTAKQLEPLGDRFAPYRTAVAWWCWREVEAWRGRAR